MNGVPLVVLHIVGVARAIYLATRKRWNAISERVVLNVASPIDIASLSEKSIRPPKTYCRFPTLIAVALSIQR